MASSPSAPGLLGEPRVLQGERGAVAGARDDRHPARRLLDGRGDAGAELLGRQRVELAGAAAREDRRRPGLDPAAHMRAEDVEVDGAVRAVGGDGEEQQARRGARRGRLTVTGSPSETVHLCASRF